MSAPDSSSLRSRIVGQCRTGTTSRCDAPRCSRVTRMAASSLRRRMVYGFSPRRNAQNGQLPLAGSTMLFTPVMMSRMARTRRWRRRCCPPHRVGTRSRLFRLASDNGPVVDVEPERFEEMVAEALDGLPEGLGRLMQNVAVTVEHGPGPPGLLGLYQGIPLTGRTSQYAGVLPDRITIYRRAICAICRTEPEVADQVRRTVIHEVAHHFGIDDDRLRELGW